MEAALGLPSGVHSYALLPVGYRMSRFAVLRWPMSSMKIDGANFSRSYLKLISNPPDRPAAARIAALRRSLLTRYAVSVWRVPTPDLPAKRLKPLGKSHKNDSIVRSKPWMATGFVM